MIKGYADNINFNLPDRKKASKSDLDLSKKAVAQWRDNLPMANANMAGKEIHLKVRDSNQYIVSGKDRLSFLENCMSAVDMVVEAMDRSFVGQSFPLNDRASKSGQDAIIFMSDLALSYQLAVVEMANSDGSVSLLHRKTVSLAAHRCCYFLSQAIIRAFQLYQPVHDGAWKTLHRLLQYSENRKLNKKSFAMPADAQQLCTIGSMYQALLCVSAANPYRMRQIDIHPLFKVLLHHPVSWNKLKIDQVEDGAFVVDPDDDMGPVFFKGTEAHGVAIWGLDLSLAREALNAQLSKARQKVMSQPGAESIEKALSAWGGIASRNFKRLAGEYQLDVVFGLHAIHYVSCGKMDFEEFLSQTGMIVTLEELGNDGANWAGQTNTGSLAELMPARVQDQSLGGYRLAFDSQRMPKIQVGELVSMSQCSSNDADRDWVVGVVSWMNSRENKEIEVGVQLITRQIEPMAFKTLKEANNGVHRGLLVEDQQGRSLIVLPTHLGKTGEVITITNRSIALEMGIIPEDMVVKIGDAIEQTTSFSLLEYEQTSHSEKQIQEQKVTNKNSDPDFDFDLDSF